MEDADLDDLDQATTYLMRAGAKATQRFAPREAIVRYEQALLVAGRLGQDLNDVRASCHEGLGDGYSLLGEYEPAFSHYQAALTVLLEDSTRRADLQWKIAVIFERQARYEQAIEWLEHSLKALDNHIDDALSPRYAIYYGMIRCRQGRLNEGLAWAEKSMVHETAQAHNIMAIVMRAQGNLEKAQAHCRRSIELAEQTTDFVTLAKANTNLGVVLFELGKWQRLSRSTKRL